MPYSVHPAPTSDINILDSNIQSFKIPYQLPLFTKYGVGLYVFLTWDAKSGGILNSAKVMEVRHGNALDIVRVRQDWFAASLESHQKVLPPYGNCQIMSISQVLWDELSCVQSRCYSHIPQGS